MTVEGYLGDEMEPFLSPSGEYLFFNSSNTAGTTNLYYATRASTTPRSSSGERSVAPTARHSMRSPRWTHEATSSLYSTRSDRRTLSTVYEGKFSNGSVTGVALVSGISKAAPGWVNFDADISANGSQLYFDDGDYGRSGQLLSARLAIAAETRTGFERLPTADKILESVNDTSALIYAPDISRDGLRLYYTRGPLPLGSGPPSIFVATRSNVSRVFGQPSRLSQLHGFVEAPALSPDGRGLYFHRLVGSHYVIEFAADT